MTNETDTLTNSINTTADSAIEEVKTPSVQPAVGVIGVSTIGRFFRLDRRCPDRSGFGRVYRRIVGLDRKHKIWKVGLLHPSISINSTSGCDLR